MTGNVPPGVPSDLITPQGNMPAIGIPNSQDYARLIFSAPYFEQIPIAEIIQPSVTEAVEAVLPSLVPQYVDAAVLAGVQQYSVLLTGSTMTGPLFLNPLMPTADSQAATKAYVDAMLATAGIPEVPPVPTGQVWGRETGQWVPISEAGGTFLPLSGGTMQGNINMSGNTLTNMAAVPAMPNGAAPAQWVLNQIASVSLYQGTWDADTNAPDLTQLSVRVNGYTWIAITTSVSGVVVSQPIPGLQGLTVYNGDTIIYSTVQGIFTSIHAGGLTLPEADARYVQLAGSQMSGALLLNANASQNMQAVTYQQLEAAVANSVTPDAPSDGQAYLRVGVGANRWVPGLPLAGGILTGALTLAGPGASGNNAVTVTQLNSAVSGVAAGLMPIAGGTFTGAVVLNGNATVALNPVPLQQLNAMVGSYAPLSGATFTGPVTLPAGSTVAGYLPLSGGTLTGALSGTTLGLSGTLTGAAATFSGAVASTLAAPAIGLSVSGNASFGVTNNGVQINQGSIVTNHDITVGGNANVAGIVAFNSNTAGFSGGALNPCTGIVCAGAVVAGSSSATAGGTVMGGWGIEYRTYTSNQISLPWNGGGALNVYADNTSLGYISFTPSDANLKENFADISVDPLAVLNEVALQQYDWKPRTIGETAVSMPHASCGFTAQQMQTLIPEAVIAGPTLGIDTMPLIAYCIGAIQQLAARVGALDGKSA